MNAKPTTAVAPRPAGQCAARPAARAGVQRAGARFWVCAVLLGASAVATHVLPPLIGVHLRKEAVPLKKPLAMLDVRKLGPRYERHTYTDHVAALSSDTEDSLGTKEYAHVYVADTTKARTDPTRVASLFITYYTGKPDMVPHVPDECYLAVGYDALGSRTEAVTVRGRNGADERVPIRVIRFRAPHNRRSASQTDEVAVLYFFSVNARYATSRDGVRLTLSDPFERFAYYAKIEISFTDDTILRGADAEASLAALGPLLEAVLPVLFEEHIDLSKFTPAQGPNDDARR